jgi:predicted phage tail protein
MNFLNQLLRGIAFVPALVNGIEGLFGNKSGAEKKDAAMSFLESALTTMDAVAAREIVEPEKFKSGISMIVDGVVQCLNASAWAKGGGQESSVSSS